MPELPEVETVLRGIQPLLENEIVKDIDVRQAQLRWQIPQELKRKWVGQKIFAVTRRGKYLLFHTKKGTAILHFGMSGHLSILKKRQTPNKHDHFDIFFHDFYLRYTDPRRFGALLWTEADPLTHPLLASLGVEPLEQDFNGRFLYANASKRKVVIKKFIMDHTVVVGVGNIYAAEALFLAGINPLTPTNLITQKGYDQLAQSIKKVLRAAIKKGGTTFKNFQSSDGRPGYFTQVLNVYGRQDMPCRQCHTILEQIRIQNRATVFCPKCQPLVNS